MTAAGPAPLWVPSAERQASSQLGRWCKSRGFATYDEAWQWSVAPGTAGDFWGEISSHFGVKWRSAPVASLEKDLSRPPGYRWFRGGELNYAERALEPPPEGTGALAVIARSDTRGPIELTWGQLSDLVAALRTGLAAAGVAAGDRVAGYLPNIPESLAAMLACASLGAIWTCCAPEMGAQGALDRLSQVGPRVLISVDGYRYGEREVDRAEVAGALRSGLPTLKKAFWLGYLRPDRDPPPGWAGWDELTSSTGPLEFAALGFDHPLYILFSSGTTGKPKAITHGHGGITLEHLKALGFHFDVGPGDRLFWFTTTGWMMWNFAVSGLLAGAAVVLFDGDPTQGEGGALWALVESTGTTCAGVGASYLVSCMKSTFSPRASLALGKLKTLGVTGSPLPAAAARWVYEAVGPDLMLESFSGGTDVCTGFVGSTPLHPVWAGEISCRCLGAKVEVFGDDGHPVVGEEGELVLSGPLPSMPVAFWGDDGTRYKSSYFGRFPGVWAHGDRATLSNRGTVVITGRSDGTLNRAGVRMGTAEFYSVVEGFAGVSDSLVVHLEDPEGGPGELWLFVVGDGGTDQNAAVTEQIRAALRKDLSPRYVPDRVVWVPSVPRTLSGKKLEVPVKRVLCGAPVGEALALTAVSDPSSIEPFVRLGRERAGGGPATSGQ